MKILKTALKYGSNAERTYAKATSLVEKISNETPRELRNNSPAKLDFKGLHFLKKN